MPVSATVARPTRLASRRPQPPTVRTLSVLVVDDTNRDRNAVVDLLQQTLGDDAQIRQCDSGLGALESLRRMRTDVVLIDYHLSDMDGLELVSAVADMADDMAVLLMSSRGSGRVAADALKHGARDYLDRDNLDAATLETALTEALRSARLEWHGNRSARQLRHDHKQVGIRVRDASRHLNERIDELGASIDELKRVGRGAPLRQLADHFGQVEEELRRSMATLADLAEPPAGG